MKILKAVLITIIFSFLLSGTVFAKPAGSANKKVDVFLPKKYETCTFILSFEVPGQYDAYLISPKGNEYACSVIDNKTSKCFVEKVEEGSWSAEIYSDKEVGKVKVSVEGNTSEVNTIDEIKVGKDVNNLSAYMKDQELHVDWNDESVPSLHITVSNISNKQELYSGDCRDKKFALTIDADVKTILVSVVPSNSKGINEAAQTFTIDTEPQFNAQIEFPEGEYINQTTLPVNIKLNGEYYVSAICNDTTSLRREKKTAGSYELEIPLLSDSNAVAILLEDANGNIKTYQKSVIVDTDPPMLTFDSLYDNVHLEYTEEEYPIKGKVTGQKELLINDALYSNIASDGTFSYPVTLHAGENIFEIKATDETGNDVTYVCRIIMADKPKYNDFMRFFNLAWPAIVVIIMVVVAVVFLSRLKSKINAPKTVKNGNADKGCRVTWLRKLIFAPKTKEENKDEEISVEKKKIPSRAFLGARRVSEQVIVGKTEEESGVKSSVVASLIKNHAQDNVDADAADFSKTEESKVVTTVNETRYRKVEALPETEVKKSDDMKEEIQKAEKAPIIAKQVSEEKHEGEENIENVQVNSNKMSSYDVLSKAKDYVRHNKVFIGCIAGVVLFFILFNLFFILSKVMTGSMEPTFPIGSRQLYWRMASDFQRGDIVIFKTDEGERMAKRIIGLPGENISFHDGFVFINGEMLDESSYISSDIETNCACSFDIPEGCVFLLGDNRENSVDARYWNNPFIKIRDLEGKCVVNFSELF